MQERHFLDSGLKPSIDYSQLELLLLDSAQREDWKQPKATIHALPSSGVRASSLISINVKLTALPIKHMQCLVSTSLVLCLVIHKGHSEPSAALLCSYNY